MQRNRIILILGVIIGLAVSLALIRYAYSVPEIGFSEYIPPTSDTQRAKTLWDWLELLIVPAVLAAAAILFNAGERRREQKSADQRDKTSREIADENRRQTLLQSYLDKITELLLEQNLQDPAAPRAVRTIARAHTLAVLRVLDPKRKAVVLQFLYDSELIARNQKSVDLGGANFSFIDFDPSSQSIPRNLSNIDLSGAILTGAQSSGLDLSSANLSDSVLWLADLERTRLVGADLRNANLMAAQLVSADLSAANLAGANLQSANLTRAKLDGAILRGANLQRISSLLPQAMEITMSLPNLNENAARQIGSKTAVAAMVAPTSFLSALSQVATLADATMPDGRKWEGKAEGPYSIQDLAPYFS